MLVSVIVPKQSPLCVLQHIDVDFVFELLKLTVVSVFIGHSLGICGRLWSLTPENTEGPNF